MEETSVCQQPAKLLHCIAELGRDYTMAKIVLKSDTMNSAPSGAVIAERLRLEPTVAQFG
jgi:hypothetical protein